MEEEFKKIKEFEGILDSALLALPSIHRDGPRGIRLAGTIIEHAYNLEDAYGLADHHTDGLHILAPFFVNRTSRHAPRLTQLATDLHFAGVYFLLREYLYYSYNAPGSFAWEFGDNRLSIKFRDRTIPRQFFLQANNHFTRSIELFSDYGNEDRIRALLAGQNEFSSFPGMQEVWRLLRKEADTKLSSYYSFLDPDDSTDLSGYTYGQFYRIFRTLLVKALYHRYHSSINGVSGTIIGPLDDFVEDLHEDTGIPIPVCAAVIDDMCYGRRAARERIEPVHFSLYELSRYRQILLMPHDFCLHEGLVSFLRVYALRHPQLFEERISGKLSDSFVRRIQEMFVKQGFKCSRNVGLKKLDRSLPDIDLLVISEEPTLGYVVFCCEVKNPIPPQWAKDQLRVLNRDSIAKAFSQLRSIGSFLVTEQGAEFIRSLLPAQGLPHFGQEFVILIKFLIITSGNAGMFFGDKDETVVDYQTLGAVLGKCDGDVAYLLTTLGSLPAAIDEAMTIAADRVTVGNIEVSYEGVQLHELLGYADHHYASDGTRERLIADFVNGGYHPYDVLDDLRDDTSETDESS